MKPETKKWLWVAIIALVAIVCAKFIWFSGDVPVTNNTNAETTKVDTNNTQKWFQEQYKDYTNNVNKLDSLKKLGTEPKTTKKGHLNAACVAFDSVAVGDMTKKINELVKNYNAKAKTADKKFFSNSLPDTLKSL